METKSVLSEVIRLLEQILSELITNDRDTPENLSQIKSELGDIADRQKLIDDSGNSNIMPKG